MSQLTWTKENITQLGNLFLMKVEGNMRFEESTVQFGVTGIGEKPNYQVTLPNGRSLTFNGASHDRDKRTDLFNGDNLSEPFTTKEVSQARGKI